MKRKRGQSIVTTGGEPIMYQIRCKGHLSSGWSDWFEGMTVTMLDNGDTVLIGPVPDQSSLHGLLKKVRDLGIPLISVLPMKEMENK